MFKKTILIFALATAALLKGEPIKDALAAKSSFDEEEDTSIVEVEYLESTGTQYIDTGWSGVANRYYYFAVDFQFIANANDTDICGIRHQNTIYHLTYYGSVIRGFTNSSLVGSAYTRHIYEFNRIIDGEYKQTIDGVEKAGGSYGTKQFPSVLTAYTFPLFGRKWNNNTVRNKSTARIYGFTIADVTDQSNPVVLVDMVPVRIGNTGYMLDVLSGELFGNDGSGSFIIGPDKE